MKVRCIKSDEWVTAGNEYLVLGVYGRGSSFKYRLIGDDKHTPAFHDSMLFEITSSKIPGDWIFKIYSGVEWEITPAACGVDGFWNAYFDGDARAMMIFSQVVSSLEEQAQ